MTAVALIGGAVIGGVSTAWSANKAANAQRQAAQTAQNTQMQMFNRAQANLQPYMNLGTNAMGMYNRLLGLGGPGGPSTQEMQQALQNMPGFQFTNYYGQQAVQNGMAARGLGSSGAALQAGAKFATGLADQNYQQYLGDIGSAVGLGENAAAGVGNMAMSAGSSMAQEQMMAGQAQAAGYNAIGAGVNNALTGGVQGYLGAQYLQGNGLLGGSSAAGADSTGVANNPYLPYQPMPSYLTGSAANGLY